MQSQWSSNRGGEHWLVYDGATGEAGPSLRFTLVDGRVASMIAGLGVMADEHCA